MGINGQDWRRQLLPNWDGWRLHTIVQVTLSTTRHWVINLHFFLDCYNALSLKCLLLLATLVIILTLFYSAHVEEWWLFYSPCYPLKHTDLQNTLSCHKVHCFLLLLQSRELHNIYIFICIKSRLNYIVTMYEDWTPIFIFTTYHFVREGVKKKTHWICEHDHTRQGGGGPRVVIIPS